MKPARKTAAPKPKSQMKIVVDPKDPRSAKVIHDGVVLFTIRTDLSGTKPSIMVVATETHLKFMESGRTGISLWNGAASLAKRSLSFN